MTEDLKREVSSGGDALHFRLCRHNFAGTIHLTNLWWADSEDDVLGTGALPESVWIDAEGRARLQVSVTAHQVRLHVLSADARECLTPVTTYRFEANGVNELATRLIAEEVDRELESMDAATRGLAVADAWLAVLESVDLREAWRLEMHNRGYAGDVAVDLPYHSATPVRLVQQARRTWASAYEGAKQRHAKLTAEWKALKAEVDLRAEED